MMTMLTLDKEQLKQIQQDVLANPQKYEMLLRGGLKSNEYENVRVHPKDNREG